MVGLLVSAMLIAVTLPLPEVTSGLAQLAGTLESATETSLVLPATPPVARVTELLATVVVVVVDPVRQLMVVVPNGLVTGSGGSIEVLVGAFPPRLACTGKYLKLLASTYWML
jgi:hypothetical protein